MSTSGTSYNGTTTDGNDKLIGGSGTDDMSGGDGNDYLNGGSGSDVLDGGSGFDTVLGGSGADTLIFYAYQNQYILGGTYVAGSSAYTGTLSGGTIYNDGTQTTLTSFSGYDNYDGGNGTVKTGTAETDALKVYVSVQQSNDLAFMQALNNEIDYFNNVWYPLHKNAQTGQADQSVYEFKSINLKISAIETIAIGVDLSTNRAPVNGVPSDALLANEDTQKPISGVSVSDPDGGALTTTISVINGTLTVDTTGLAAITGNGSNTVIISGTAAEINTALAGLAYTGNPDFNGTDTLTMASTDSLAIDIDNFSITVTEVNDAPVATDDSLSSVAEDSGTRTISFASVLGNDSAGATNESGQTLTITALANVVGGSAVINGTNIEFTPDANFNGTASFDYTVEDNGTTNGAADPESDTGQVSFTVTEVNDAPVATDDKLVISSNTTAVLPAIALLGNDTDVDGNKLHIVSVSGAVSYNAVTDTVTFTSAGGTGLNVATFTYTVSDGVTTSVGSVSVDVVNANAGFDLSDSYATAGSYQAAFLDLGGGPDDGTGAGGLDIFVGGSGNDTLIGGSGNDILRGGSGDDTLDGDSGTDLIDFSDGTSTGLYFTLTQSSADTDFNASDAGRGTDTYRNMEGVIGTNFNDILTGSASGDVLNGAGGNDTINGGSGSDTIIGGAGQDMMTGGTDADTFIFLATSDSSAGGNRDVIMDFTPGSDKVDLSTIDANTVVPSYQAFTSVTQDTCAQANSITWYQDVANNRTIIQGDVNGNTVADFEIQLTGLKTLTVDDFLV
jgi:Ca2+-binding RTX toxin-like protein